MHLQMLNFKHHGAQFPGLMCPFCGRPALGERFLGTNSISLLYVHSKLIAVYVGKQHQDFQVRCKTLNTHGFWEMVLGRSPVLLLSELHEETP